MDALKLLAEDHHNVKKLFQEAEASADEKEKRKVFREIESELETHARIEENIFYPAMKKHDGLKDMVRESLKEHSQVKSLLRAIKRLKPGSDRFEPRLQELKENVEHHAEEEEEGKMFPKIRKILDQQDLENLGDDLESEKTKRHRKAG